MEDLLREAPPTSEARTGDVPSIVRQAIEEFMRREQAKSEPAYKVELQEERKRREQLERRLNELVDENRKHRQLAEEAERSATVRAEFQRLGVGKVDLALRAVRDEITRTEDGRLVAKTDRGEVALRDYLTSFVSENPEFLPARISGGAGLSPAERSTSSGSGTVDLDKIRPGMSTEEMRKVREEIARLANQTLRGL